MAYTEPLPEAIELLLRHKELASLKVPKFHESTGINPNFIDDDLKGHLFLQPHQLFVRAYMGPDSGRKRLFCEHETGTGKTLTAIATAFEYVKYYKAAANTGRHVPHIYIIGFSHSVFQRELLNRPEFGFINKEEIHERERLHNLANNGTQADKIAANDYDIKLRSRLSKLQWDGYFKFIGYKELVNHLFIRANNEELEANNAEYYYDAIKDGRIRLNFDLIDSFANSFVICDEIHNTYNATNINNYGVALQMIFDIYEMPEFVSANLGGAISKERIDLYKHSIVKLLMLTATPMNNSSTEIVDILNLLVPDLAAKHLTKNDLFELVNGINNLRPGAADKIANLVRGYVSYLRDVNPKKFPGRVIEGETIDIPKEYLDQRSIGYTGTILPYMRFIRCDMSPLHYETYKEAIHDTGAISTSGRAIIDGVLPMPDSGDLSAAPVDDEYSSMAATVATTTKNDISDKPIETTTVGMYKTNDIRSNLIQASTAWRDKYGISYQVDDKGAGIITGEFMRAETLVKYSTKYAILVESLIDNLRNDRGKVLISHQYVRMLGVLFLQEVLKRNGFIDEFANPTDDTLCSICGSRRDGHDYRKCSYSPARFIMAQGELDKTVMARSQNKFNHVDNSRGHKYRILIGSAVINEAYDFNCIQQIYIMHLPNDISTVMQILGRGIRNMSHALLPPEMRFVHVFIMVSSIPKADRKPGNEISYEELHYFYKLQEYLVIQRIDKILHENAIDGTTFRSIIMPDESEASIKALSNELGMLYFRPSNKLFTKHLLDIGDGKKEWSLADLDTNSFMARYADDEIAQIVFIIKRLFIEQSQVWKYGDLWAAVRSPPFEIHVNTKLYSENCFIIALDLLTCMSSTHTLNFSKTKSALLDPTNCIMMLSGLPHRIFWRSPFYVLLPLQPVGEHSSEYGTQQLGEALSAMNEAPQLLTECWLRKETPVIRKDIPIGRSMHHANISFDQMKYRFFTQYRDAPLESMPTTAEIYDLDFHAAMIAEAIKYAFDRYINHLPPTEMHSFYFKLLYYYDKLEMLVFADELSSLPNGDELVKRYGNLIGPVDFTFGTHTTEMTDEDKTKLSKLAAEKAVTLNNFLFTSVYKHEKPAKMFSDRRLNEYLAKHNGPLPCNLLPVGHFLQGDLTLYIPTVDTNTEPVPRIKDALSPTMEWITIPVTDFNKSEEVENDIIIGYYEKNPTGIDVRFKLRHPMQKIIRHRDTRLIERGATCSTWRKEDLVRLAVKLGISTPDSVRDLCNVIKVDLMKKEIDSRREWQHTIPSERKPRTRWFYMHFERQPKVENK